MTIASANPQLSETALMLALPAGPKAVVDRIRDALEAADATRLATIESLRTEAQPALARAFADHDKIANQPQPILDQKGAPRGFGLLPADEPRVVAAKVILDAAKAEVKRREARMTAAAEIAGLLRPLLDRCEAYARQLLRSGPIREAKATVPPKATIATLRARLAELDEEADRVKAAPVPSGEVRARAFAAIDDLARRGEPSLGVASMFHQSAPGLSFVEVWQRVDHHLTAGDKPVNGAATVRAPDTLALIAWLMPDALKAKIGEEIDRHADDAAALTPVQRAARLDQLADARLAAERAECALLAAEGSVAFRRGTDPRAILAVAGPQPEV